VAGCDDDDDDKEETQTTRRRRRRMNPTPPRQYHVQGFDVEVDKGVMHVEGVRLKCGGD